MNVALDTNILAYAEGLNGARARASAIRLLRGLRPDQTLIPVQVLGELFAVLVRKANRSRTTAAAAILSWGDAYPLVETSGDVIIAATDLAVTHQLSIWDAIVLSAAADAGCRMLLSEDLQDGFTWHGVTVANPFATPQNPLLEAVLSSSRS